MAVPSESGAGGKRAGSVERAGPPAKKSGSASQKRGLSAKRKRPGNAGTTDRDVRRQMALALAVLMLLASLLAWQFASGSSGAFVAAACGRIGLVLGALWLAWPSLKRPARWLPAGAPVIGVVALIVVAAQPRLILPAIPIVGVLITVSGFARAFRGKGPPTGRR